jgi:hypothetical protein
MFSNFRHSSEAIQLAFLWFSYHKDYEAKSHTKTVHQHLPGKQE